ncbi:MAG: hypothetical protein IPP55_07695 [Anaerolineales bacterium]|nr:hypothetical protein [Anaerolineales bacterium]
MVRLASRICPAAAISSFIPVSQGGETRRFLLRSLALPLRQGRSQQGGRCPTPQDVRIGDGLPYNPPHPHADKVSHRKTRRNRGHESRHSAPSHPHLDIRQHRRYPTEKQYDYERKHHHAHVFEDFGAGVFGPFVFGVDGVGREG